MDPGRDWCDLASLVRVESVHPCGDHLTSDTRGFIPTCSPGSYPCCRRYASTGHRNRPLLSCERCLLRRPPFELHGPGHRQLAPAEPVLRVGMVNKRLAAARNKDCPCRLIGLNSKPGWTRWPWDTDLPARQHNPEAKKVSNQTAGPRRRFGGARFQWSHNFAVMEISRIPTAPSTRSTLQRSHNLSIMDQKNPSGERLGQQIPLECYPNCLHAVRHMCLIFLGPWS